MGGQGDVTHGVLTSSVSSFSQDEMAEGATGEHIKQVVSPPFQA